jgi:hypothetical protein
MSEVSFDYDAADLLNSDKFLNIQDIRALVCSTIMEFRFSEISES